MVYQEEMAEMDLQGEMVGCVDMELLDLRDKEAPTRGLRSLGRRYEVSGFRSKVSGTHAHIRGATRS